MRTIGRILGVALLAFVAFKLVGWALAIIAATVVFTVKLAIVAGLVLAGVWGFRRLTRGRRRRRGRPAELGTGSLDLAFIRGKIDEETYYRERAVRRARS